jgi:ABC-type proline/glycine betaine transport system ATPase subunit
MMTASPLTPAELLAQPADDYMNAAQQHFFRTVLLSQRDALQARIAEEFAGLRERETNSDPAGIGSAEAQRQWQLRLLERAKRLLDKIDEALGRRADRPKTSAAQAHCEPVHRSQRASGTTRKTPASDQCLMEPAT